MLDINSFRIDKGGDPDIVRQSQRKRFADESLVDKVIEADSQWRKANYQTEQMSKEMNSLSKQVAILKKAGGTAEEVAELVARSKTVRASMVDVKAAEEQALEARTELLLRIGNIVHDDVPTGNDEADNRVLHEVGGQPPSEPWMLSHSDLIERLGFVNLVAGQAAAGARGYYLLGFGVLLNQALINYSLQFLVERGYEPVQTPFFLMRDVMSECAQLSEFDDMLYRVTEGQAASSSGGVSDKYLVATSEQALCAMHRKGWIDPAELPLRYAGFSTCFRTEAGSHGKDTLGIFRTHQFEKVEQFCITEPAGGASWRAMEEMIGHAGDFYSSLGLPYRVVSIVSGALNRAAAMKFDLEGWFPAGQAYRELVSCSNCTDYQSRRLDIRMHVHRAAAAQPQSADRLQAQAPLAGSAPAGGASAHVHMINSTLAATQRTLCCVLENHQTPEGVRVPQPLRAFLGTDFLPFKAKALGSAALRLARQVVSK